MVTAARVADKVRRSRIVPMPSEDPDLWLLIFVNLEKIISTMIMTPPEAKPNPRTEYTKI